MSKHIIRDHERLAFGRWFVTRYENVVRAPLSVLSALTSGGWRVPIHALECSHCQQVDRRPGGTSWRYEAVFASEREALEAFREIPTENNGRTPHAWARQVAAERVSRRASRSA